MRLSTFIVTLLIGAVFMGVIVAQGTLDGEQLVQ